MCDFGLHHLRMDPLLLVALPEPGTLEQMSNQMSPEVPSNINHPLILWLSNTNREIPAWGCSRAKWRCAQELPLSLA